MKKLNSQSFVIALVVGLIFSPFWLWAFFLYRDGGVISSRLLHRVQVEAGGYLELGLLVFFSLYFIPSVIIVAIGLAQFLGIALFKSLKLILHALSRLWKFFKACGRLLRFVIHYLWLVISSKYF